MFPGTGRCKAALGCEISRVTVSQENRMMLLISDLLCKVISSLLTCNFKHLFLYRITAALRYCFQNPLHCSRGEKAPPVNLHFTEYSCTNPLCGTVFWQRRLTQDPSISPDPMTSKGEPLLGWGDFWATVTLSHSVQAHLCDKHPWTWATNYF